MAAKISNMKIKGSRNKMDEENMAIADGKASDTVSDSGVGEVQYVEGRLSGKLEL